MCPSSFGYRVRRGSEDAFQMEYFLMCEYSNVLDMLAFNRRCNVEGGKQNKLVYISLHMKNTITCVRRLLVSFFPGSCNIGCDFYMQQPAGCWGNALCI